MLFSENSEGTETLFYHVFVISEKVLIWFQLRGVSDLPLKATTTITNSREVI